MDSEDWDPDTCRPKQYKADEGFYYQGKFCSFNEYPPEIWAQYLHDGKVIYPYMFKIQGRSAVLKNGQLMPLLGLGCWQSPSDEVLVAVECALDNGYRHIDTAYNYLNEEAVGQGIQNWLKKSDKHQREDVFVVTKLPMIGMYSGGPKLFLEKSLKKLNLSYVDQFLVHAPFGMQGKNEEDVFPMKEDGTALTDPSTDLIAIWKEMESLVEQGLTKSIGVSNFNVRQLVKLNAIAKIPPVVIQVEMHVEFQQKELVKYCRENDMVVTAYGPLGSPGRARPINERFGKDTPPPSLLDNPVVKLVAANHKVTTAQVLIKFLIQQGVPTFPKSVTPDRIKINADVFSFQLTDTELDALKELDKGEDGRSFNWLGYKGIRDHPECPLQSYTAKE